MAECELIQKCPFFHDKMANMPGTADLFKNFYCRSDNRGCARHMIVRTVGKQHVPIDLFPNQVDRAEAIIGEHSVETELPSGSVSLTSRSNLSRV